jgi:hypothetical protein
MGRRPKDASAHNAVAAEIAAIGVVYEALNPLPSEGRERVLRYVMSALSVELASGKVPAGEISDSPEHTLSEVEPRDVEVRPSEGTGAVEEGSDSEMEGISPVATKWMRRNGLSEQHLEGIYSLGLDEIDLVAEKVPGGSKRKRMRSVFLLKGVSAFLSSGVARYTHDQIREICQHYDAWDATNFGRDLSAFSAEVGGTKETGYQLTPRGLGAAAQLIKDMKAGTK